MDSILECAEKLKIVKRRGWLLRGIDENDCESVSEHSYCVAIISAIIAYERNLNIERAVIMALIHDLPEAITGDYTPHDDVNKKEILEKKAAEEILGNSYLYEVWKEWMDGKSDVARLVREADNFERYVQAINYSKKYDVSEFIMEGRNKRWKDDMERLLKDD